MKSPISKPVLEYLILILAGVVLVLLLHLVESGSEFNTETGLLLLIILTVLGLLLYTLFSKKLIYKEPQKCNAQNRWFRLPFASHFLIPVFTITFISIIAGLFAVLSENQTSSGINLLILGSVISALMIAFYEHPRIWFSDTINVEDELQKLTLKRDEQLDMYKNGIFGYRENGFFVSIYEKLVSIKWDEVDMIRAYKIDNLTSDTIVFEVHVVDTFFKFDDQTPGHMKFMDKAAENLDGFNENWFQSVAFPAFRRNNTIVFNRIFQYD
jgi:hypothetical protein